MAEPGGSSTAIPDAENIDAVSAGKGVDNNNESPMGRRTRMRMLAERKRRSLVMDYLGQLKALMPHVTEKCDTKGTIVAEAFKYIQSLEKTKAALEKRKQVQVATEAAASSSAPPQEPLAADVPQPLQEPLGAAVPAPPQFPTEAAGLVGFQTWSWPNLVLNVSNDNAYINVCSPRHLSMKNLKMVLSVLNNFGIDVVAAQIDSDAVRSVFNIYARVTRMGGEEVYKLAMSEILLLLNTD